ncbi:unnamed protein product [Gongylonema pulchrum]|uniref:Leuk-A4-hydro_C domain-containing protein n=1 Tax=Gongylonema pulchrum TaxID=637853 RepID=A0A183D9Y0_9BILA|nr:unnamed protein product [Gongylonema pulchrum]
MRDAIALARQWAEMDDGDLAKIDSSRYNSLSTLQKVKVLDHLRLASNALSHEKLAHLDKVNKFSKAGNYDILSSWIQLGLKNYWEDIIPLALDFVTKQGRLKYVRPIYNAGRAIETFMKNAPYMHPITVSTVSKLIPK